MNSIGDAWIPILGTAIALLIWEYAWRPTWNYVWRVPEAMHLSLLNDAEEKKEETEAEISSMKAKVVNLQASIVALQAQLNKVVTDQVFADLLTARYDEGVHEILNWGGLRKHSLFTDDIGREWNAREKKWTLETRLALEKHGCTQQIITFFWDLQKVTPGAYHPNGRMNHALSMFDTRLDRLKVIIDLYSEIPIFTRSTAHKASLQPERV